MFNTTDFLINYLPLYISNVLETYQYNQDWFQLIKPGNILQIVNEIFIFSQKHLKVQQCPQLYLKIIKECLFFTLQQPANKKNIFSVKSSKLLGKYPLDIRRILISILQLFLHFQEAKILSDSIYQNRNSQLVNLAQKIEKLYSCIKLQMSFVSLPYYLFEILQKYLPLLINNHISDRFNTFLIQFMTNVQVLYSTQQKIRKILLTAKDNNIQQICEINRKQIRQQASQPNKQHESQKQTLRKFSDKEMFRNKKKNKVIISQKSYEQKLRKSQQLRNQINQSLNAPKKTHIIRKKNQDNASNGRIMYRTLKGQYNNFKKRIQQDFGFNDFPIIFNGAKEVALNDSAKRSSIKTLDEYHNEFTPEVLADETPKKYSNFLSVDKRIFRTPFNSQGKFINFNFQSF